VQWGANQYVLAALSGGELYSLRFDYVADTNNTQSWAAGGTHGYELLGGTATVTLSDITYGLGTVVKQGTLTASNNLFVSVDNGNFSIGLGTGGLPPGAAGFPAYVAYPFGLEGGGGSAFGAYDLSTALDPVSGIALACTNFPTAVLAYCGAPLVLQLADGESFDITEYWSRSANFAATVVSPPVSEPATLGLLFFGLAAIGFTRKLKSN